MSFSGPSFASVSELDGSEGQEYMQFYDDLQIVPESAKVLVLHTVTGGVEYAVTIPKSHRPKIKKGKLFGFEYK